MNNQPSTPMIADGRWADTRARLLTALIGGPAVLWIVYLGGVVYAVAAVIIVSVCSIELQRMITRHNTAILPMLLTNGAVLAASFELLPYFAVFGLLLLALVPAYTFLQNRYMAPQQNHLTAAALIIGGLYVGLPIAALIDLRSMEDGLAWIYLLLATNWLTDSFALIGGRLFGRTQVAARVSAGKTWEGVFSGVGVGTLSGTLVGVGFGLPLAPMLAITFTMAVLTVIGDLIESVFKRYYNIKDSGGVLPGHGGILDRVDGLVLAIIPLYATALLL